jgi:hypothetical protein
VLLTRIWGNLTDWTIRVFACAKREACKPGGIDMESRIGP